MPRKRELFATLEREGNYGGRLAAARELAELAEKRDLPRLRKLLSVERVAWIRSALSVAIQRLSGSMDEPHDPAPDDQAEAIDATERVSKILVHEIRPRLGRVDLSASLEIANYEDSQTAAELARLRDLVDVLEELGSSAATPRNSAFDLTAEVHAIANEQVEEHERRTGRRPEVQFMVLAAVPLVSDARKVRMILGNALRNAFEATDEPQYRTLPVALSWGTTDVDAWVVLRDFGPGLDAPPSALIQPATTSKATHFGMGLTIADQAARSLQGRITPRSAEGRGTIFEVRWPL